MKRTKRTLLCVAFACVAGAASHPSTTLAVTGTIAGVELGAANPDGDLSKREDVGASISPFFGYMFNDYLGLVGSAHYAGFPYKDREGLTDHSMQVLAGLAGPRLALPLGGLELFASWQGGVFTGLRSNSPVTRTSWGFATGGGFNFPVAENCLLGGFAKYHWLDQNIDHGNLSRTSVAYITTGVALTYNPPPPPEAPPVVAVAEPEPAPEPPPPPPAKKKLVLRGVNFDFDRADIRPDARPVLDEAIAVLEQEGGVAVIAEGHTDSDGSDEYNEGLSLRRAEAVRDYLVAGGIGADRISVRGFGESRPVADNDSDDGKAQNRRVELRIAK